MKKNSLIKKDLIINLSKKTGFPAVLSKKLINDLLMTLISILKESNINLKNFGHFKVLNKSERIGRNPKTKQEFTIASRKTVSFIASKKLLEQINI